MNILEQITEQQVVDWMQAKLESIRHDGMNVRNLGLNVCNYDLVGPCYDFTMHAHDQCVTSCQSVDVAIKHLSQKVGSKQQLAAAKRSEAEELLREAAELEAGK